MTDQNELYPNPHSYASECKKYITIENSYANTKSTSPQSELVSICELLW